MLLPPSDHERAACADADPDLFFDSKAAARRICASCPILEACQKWSLAFPGRLHGVIGGLTEGERRRLRSRAS